MENLKLHSDGQNDFIEELKNQFDKLVSEIQKKEFLSNEEKSKEIEKARTDFEKAKKEAGRNLFQME